MSNPEQWYGATHEKEHDINEIFVAHTPIPIDLIETAPSYEEQAMNYEQVWKERGIAYKLGYITMSDMTTLESIERHDNAYRFAVTHIAHATDEYFCRKIIGPEGDKLQPNNERKPTHFDHLKQWVDAIHGLTMVIHAKDSITSIKANRRVNKRRIQQSAMKFTQDYTDMLAALFKEELTQNAMLSPNEPSDQLTLADIL